MFIVDSAETGNEVTKKKSFVPHNREDLLNKIESLKLADDDDGDDFSFDSSDDECEFHDSEFDENLDD